MFFCKFQNLIWIFAENAEKINVFVKIWYFFEIVFSINAAQKKCKPIDKKFFFDKVKIYRSKLRFSF